MAKFVNNIFVDTIESAALDPAGGPQPGILILIFPVSFLSSLVPFLAPLLVF